MQGVAGVNRANKGVFGSDLNDITDGLDIKVGGNTGKNVLAKGRARDQNVRESASLDVLGDQFGERLGEALLKN